MHRKGSRMVTVEPFSDAYFALVRRLPELEPIWTRFDRVVVAGRETSIRLLSGGKSRLSSAELDAIVAGFRAR
jgi:hypothetical protein